MITPCPIRAGALEAPGAEALTFAGRSWTYHDLDRAVGRWVSALAARGVRAGDRVALLAPNEPSHVLLFFAVGRLAAVFVPLHARLSAVELAPIVADAAPRLCLTSEPLAERLPGAITLERWDKCEERPSPSYLPLAAASPRAVLYTSGTTGRSKGVVLTEANFRAAAACSAANLGDNPAPRWLGTLPLYHVGGLAMMTRTAYARGCLVLQERFDADAANRATDVEGVTHASFVATTLERLLEARGERAVPGTFRHALVGGGPVPAQLLARARAAKLSALQTYGLTEACGQVTTERPGEANGRSAGPVLPGLELRVVGPEGQALGPGQAGEIEVRGPTVMAGYLNRLEDPQSSRREGWLRTHDVGMLDGQARLTVLSRRTDLIVRGGENIYPMEIEAALVAHPAVQEVAVFGAPDRHWGEVPVALVVLRPGRSLPDELAAWCRRSLAGFKVPSRFVVTDALPRNAMGKLERARLRDRAAER